MIHQFLIEIILSTIIVMGVIVLHYILRNEGYQLTSYQVMDISAIQFRISDKENNEIKNRSTASARLSAYAN